MKKFLSGFLCALLVCGTIMTVTATTGSKSITAAYRNIKIAVDNSIVEPKDAQGNTVEPFIYNGTTYLPVRAVATALGQEVSWDDSTSTVYIGEQPAAKPQPSTPASTSKTIGLNTVIFDDSGIKVTYLGYKKDSFDNYKYEIKIENNSSMNIVVSYDNAFIDNVSEGYGPAAVCPAGKTTYATWQVSDYSLEQAHLSSYNVMGFNLKVYDEDDLFNGYEKTTDVLTFGKQ